MRIFAFILIHLSLFSETPNWQSKVEVTLWPALEKGESVDCILLLTQQPDLRGAYQLPTKKQKGQYVFQQLVTQANQTQSALKTLLHKEGIQYQSLYIINALRIEANLETVAKVAQRPEVKAVIANPNIQLPQPRVPENETSLRSQGIEWGILDIGADKVWAMGIQGQGVVVGGQDTGVEWDHPALIRQYRGNRGDTVIHDYNWYDAIHDYSPINSDTLNPCGLDLTVPCDDNLHGTHTVGTMVGADTSGNQIGVAPQAQWIAVRNMERGYGNPFSYLEAFQWFLAPTDVYGMNPDPDKAPHVINNSWYCPELEGCNESNYDILEMAVDALKAAGVVVVTSAGNEGNNCSTVNQVPAGYASAFAVGASDVNHNIASFSSRGPFYLQDSSFLIKPDVTAPGVNVRSAVLNGAYRNLNGTSMAGPHVVGTVALMISANPTLAGQVDTIEAILRRTARPFFSQQDCGPLTGDQIPNAVFGYGIIDAEAAVDAALEVVISDTSKEYPAVDLQIFPNPASEQVTIVRTSDLHSAQLQLFDLSRRLIRQQVWADNSPQTTWTLENLPKGVYILSYSTKKQVHTEKLVVQ